MLHAKPQCFPECNTGRKVNRRVGMGKTAMKQWLQFGVAQSERDVFDRQCVVLCCAGETIEGGGGLVSPAVNDMQGGRGDVDRTRMPGVRTQATQRVERLGHRLGGVYEEIGDDFEGSSIEVPAGAVDVPGVVEGLRR